MFPWTNSLGNHKIWASRIHEHATIRQSRKVRARANKEASDPPCRLPSVSVKGQQPSAKSGKRDLMRARQAATASSELSSTILPPTTYSITDTMAQQEEQPYRPKDALGSSIKATMITAGAGLFVSTIQNTLTKQNHGAMGAFTKFGGTTAVYGTRPFLD